MSKSPTIAAVIFVIAITVGLAPAQQFEHRGIQLYKEGKNVEAINLLSVAVDQKEFKSDAAIWNALGLAYIATNDFKKGRKSLERAVKLNPANSAYHVNLAYAYLLFRQTNKAQAEAKKAIELDPKNVSAYYLRGSASLWEQKLGDAEKDADQTILIDPASPQGYVLKSNILMARLAQHVANGATVDDQIGLLKQAFDLLTTGVDNSRDNRNKKVIQDEFESVEAFYKYFSKEKSGLTALGATPDPGVRPLRILSKPKPAYTDAARQTGTQGTVKIAVLFAANGKVRHLLVLKGLGYGLDQNAMNAARRIEFEPMMRNGTEVSVVRMVEYSFGIY